MRPSQLVVKASSSDEAPLDANELFTDLKEKWDVVENKQTVILYGGCAIVAVWLASIVVGAINSIPLVPKIMELVGLGYTGWFVYRYLLFKVSLQKNSSFPRKKLREIKSLENFRGNTEGSYNPSVFSEGTRVPRKFLREYWRQSMTPQSSKNKPTDGRRDCFRGNLNSLVTVFIFFKY
ncbi:protein curvature thylakoid 1a chloroplastic [Phtheirospermum japonicum]|uniref:Protein curvature thylakoid 1a chloroplastic n=1 Tax=Phtheirospermum japonicum TaxID=374723 RepID=A0A830BM94_9LAMI|nr:protein curvature thylakoid 1a chloroplastic [Phtheirospermum japonicum]